MPFFKRDLNGSGYIVLNIIRGINIIALLSIVAASFVMLVRTFVVSKFFFFDGVSHVITGFLALALIITEVGLFRRYLSNNWPLLSINSGFITLAILMIILSISILGNLNKTATSRKALGSTFWQLTIAAGVLGGIIGVINIFANYLFRDKARGLTARQVRAYGSTAPQKAMSPELGYGSQQGAYVTRSVSAPRQAHMSDVHPAHRGDGQPF
ncbi:hypothetical protein MMC21_007554 [Puttea exsequens]|nr:hypothetical protein [Puttea exsequens]